MRLLLSLPVLSLLAFPAGALAAPPISPVSTGTPSAFEHKPKPSSDRIDLQLEDADLGDLVRVIGELTGKRFVIASPKLAKTKASIYAPQKVTVAEAYQAFLAVLAANGLTVVPQAGFLKVVESQDIARQLTPIERGELPTEERYVTRIHRLAHLAAEEVASGVLSKLATKDASIVPYTPGNLLIITETSANLRRMLEVLDAIDAASEEDKLYLQPLRHVPAAQVEKQLGEILDLKKKVDLAPAGPLHVGRIVAIERPNALVIVATRGSYERILRVLEQIDVAPSNEAQVRVVMLQHADAKKIVGPINEAIGGPVGGAGGGGAGGAGGVRGGVANAPAAVLEAGAKVSADETTNSLIVTATPRDFGPIKAVIEALDRPKRQVFIEAVVLDVSAEHGLDLGVSWHGGAPSTSTFGPGTQTTYGGFRPLTSAGTPSSSELQAFALGVRGPSMPFLPGGARAQHDPQLRRVAQRGRHLEGRGHPLHAAHHRERQHAGGDQGAAQHVAAAERAADVDPAHRRGGGGCGAQRRQHGGEQLQADRPPHQGHAAPERLGPGAARRRRDDQRRAEHA